MKMNFQLTLMTLLMVASAFVFAQSELNKKAIDANADSNKLLDEYIETKGTQRIVFDASNIKQFWIDNSVLSLDDMICILQNKRASIPLRIQLANTNCALDCKIDVISETSDLSFVVLDNKQKQISRSLQEDNFIQYAVSSSSFHLEDTKDYVFYLQFRSTTADILSIKKIILSFYANKENYLYSPGKVRITPNNVRMRNCTQNPIDDDNELSVTGKRFEIFSQKRIVLSNNTLSSTITIKNEGNNNTRIYFGYAVYTKDMIQINGKNYPYDETVLNVVSSSKGSNSIIVDKYPKWKKNCYLALNAKEDFSDVPNVSFVDGTIVEVKELENGNAEIIMGKPLVSALEKGSTVRINGYVGSYLYTHSIILRPGEEQTLSSKIQKDYSCHTFSQSYSYSSEVFPKGIDYAAPIVLSYSVDKNVDNTIKIKDFVISY